LKTINFNFKFGIVLNFPIRIAQYLIPFFLSTSQIYLYAYAQENLIDQLNNYVLQMGFGTFVDKVLLPFASTVPEQ